MTDDREWFATEHRTTCCKAPPITRDTLWFHWYCSKCGVEMTCESMMYELAPGYVDEWADIIEIMQP